MAVVIETTIGDITVDLFIDERPQTCKNFLKLCKIKYYNFCLFHSVQTNFIAQTGDPTGTGKGGESVYGVMYGEESKYYEGEKMPKIKHSKLGLLSMVNYGNNMLGSQFFVTLGTELKSLEEHCVFAEVTEGHDVLIKLNEAICDHQHRPYQDIRITHTVILDDPFDDPPELTIPDASPDITSIQNTNGRIGADEKINDEEGLSEAQLQEIKEEREAKARATILEIVGDLPTADIAPPENVLFVCKLNPVTTDEDLELIFGRFGKVKSCEVIRDQQTGDSLQYAFVEFEDKKSCEQAYIKMDNVLIDDRRIHVDFSQSVSKVKWRGKGRGVEYFDKAGEKELSHRSSDRHSNKKDHHRDRDRVDRERDRDRSERRRGGDDRRRSDREPNDHRRRDRRKEDGRRREDDSLREEVRDERIEDDRRRRDTREEHRRDEEPRNERSEEDRKRRDNREDRRDDERKYSSGSSRREERRKEEERKKEEERRKETEKKWNGSERKENTSRHADNHVDGKKHDRIKNNDHEKKEDKAKDDRKNDKKDKSLHTGRPSSEKREPNLSEAQVTSDVGKSISNSKEEPALSFIEGKNKHEEVTIKQSAVSTGPSDAFLSLKTSTPPDATSQTSSKDKRRKKKRRHSSSSESSSSDSSDSSSSSSSEDYKRKPKRKTTIAKKYYHRGKLVKIIKKKKADSSDSESSDESSDSDRKRKKTKYKKIVKVIKKRKHSSSDDSDSDSSSSSEESDSSKKKSKRKSVKTSKKKKKDSKRSVKKKKRYSSDSVHSDDERSMKSNKTSDSKKHKKEIND